MTDTITKLRELVAEMRDCGTSMIGDYRVSEWADRIESAVKESLTAQGYADRLSLIRIRDAVRNYRSGLDDAESAMSVIAVALAAAPAPDGMVPIPLEPTLNMIAAGNTRIWKDRETNAGFNSEDVWGAMLNAHRESGE